MFNFAICRLRLQLPAATSGWSSACTASASTAAASASAPTATACWHERTPYRACFGFAFGLYLGAIDDVIVIVQAADDLHLGVIIQPGRDLFFYQAIPHLYPHESRCACGWCGIDLS